MGRHLDNLNSCNTRDDIARLLGYRHSMLVHILYKMPDTDKYREFEIPKKSGGIRKICSPCDQLKTLQKRLCKLLQDCIEEINKKKGIKRSLISHGFKRNHSILTNADRHKNKRYVMNIDLNNFFDSFNFGRVRGFFIKNRNFQLNEEVATVLAQIACFKNTLPQGSPVSPVITNLIGHIFDIHLSRLAKEYRCRYSRYADDITLSTNLKEFPPELGKCIDAESHHWIIGDVLESKINKQGFTINNKKTRVQYKRSRQDVTGLLVNKKPNTKPEYWRTARAMVNKLHKEGKYIRKIDTIDSDGKIVPTKREGTLAELNGMLSFIDMVDNYNYQKKIKGGDFKNKNKFSSRENTYKDFLFFKHFYQAEKPIILCEGKTDYVYLRAAVKNLHADYPDLCAIDDAGKNITKIGFFRYTKLSDRIFAINGGTGNLSKFIGEYEKQCKKYEVGISKNPVLIVVDNDSGAKSIFSVVKKNGNYKDDLIGDKPFYFVNNNLYVISIPKLNQKDTEIEDYFTKSLMQKKIKGKTFHSGKKDGKKISVDNDKHYSKAIFANKIVARQAGQIDFSEFKKILHCIQSSIEDYNSIYPS